MRGSAASVSIIHVFVVLNLSVLHDNASIDARSKVGAEDSVFGQGTKCSYMERVGSCRGSRREKRSIELGMDNFIQCTKGMGIENFIQCTHGLPIFLVIKQTSMGRVGGVTYDVSVDGVMIMVGIGVVLIVRFLCKGERRPPAVLARLTGRGF